MRLLWLLCCIAVAVALDCQCQNNSSKICNIDDDCDVDDLCICSANSTQSITLSTPTPVYTQAADQELIEATFATYTDGESAGYVVGMMFAGFGFIGIAFLLGWLRVPSS
jgi:hypothetical protein